MTPLKKGGALAVASGPALAGKRMRTIGRLVKLGAMPSRGDIDIATLLALIAFAVSVFLKPWKADEGWNAFNAYRYHETGLLIDAIGGFQLTFRALWIQALSLGFELSSWPTYWVLRLPSLGAAVAALWFWRYTAGAFRISYPGYVSGMLLMVWFFAAEVGNNTAGIGVREESFYGLGMLIALAGWARACQGSHWSSKDSLALHAGVWACALLSSAHPNGLVAWLLASAVIYRWRRLMGGRSATRAVWISVLGSCGLFLWSIRLFELGPHALVESLRAAPFAAHPFYREPVRYALFALYSPLLAMACLGGLLMLAQEATRRRRWRAEVVWSTAIVAAWLTALPLKWPIYVVLWLPHAMLGIALLADVFPLSSRFPTLNKYGGVALVLAAGLLSEWIGQVPKSLLVQERFVTTRWVAELKDLKDAADGYVLGGGLAFFPYFQNLDPGAREPKYLVHFYSRPRPEGYSYIDTIRGMDGSYYTVWVRAPDGQPDLSRAR
jgi:hypothetical protein